MCPRAPAVLPICALTIASAAFAARPTKEQCFEANENAQRLLKQGQLEKARDNLTLSLSLSCPAPVREDSAALIKQVEAALAVKAALRSAAAAAPGETGTAENVNPTSSSVSSAASRTPPSKIAGIALTAAGGVSLVVGAAFGGLAIAKKNASDADCANDLCTPDGLDLRRAGLTASYLSDGMFAAAAALGGVGIALIATAPSAKPGEKSAALLSLAPYPGGLGLRGVW